MSPNIQKVISLLSIGAMLHLGAGAQIIGAFDGHSDIGGVLHPGSVSYDSRSGDYLLSGSGANIWGRSDEFHFA